MLVRGLFSLVLCLFMLLSVSLFSESDELAYLSLLCGGSTLLFVVFGGVGPVLLLGLSTCYLVVLDGKELESYTLSLWFFQMFSLIVYVCVKLMGLGYLGVCMLFVLVMSSMLVLIVSYSYFSKMTFLHIYSYCLACGYMWLDLMAYVNSVPFVEDPFFMVSLSVGGVPVLLLLLFGMWLAFARLGISNMESFEAFLLCMYMQWHILSIMGSGIGLVWVSLVVVIQSWALLGFYYHSYMVPKSSPWNFWFSIFSCVSSLPTELWAMVNVWFSLHWGAVVMMCVVSYFYVHMCLYSAKKPGQTFSVKPYLVLSWEFLVGGELLLLLMSFCVGGFVLSLNLEFWFSFLVLVGGWVSGSLMFKVRGMQNSTYSSVLLASFLMLLIGFVYILSISLLSLSWKLVTVLGYVLAFYIRVYKSWKGESSGLSK